MKILIFYFLLFLSTFVNALSISPGELFYNITQNEEKCNSVILNSQNNLTGLIGEVKWLDDMDKLGKLSYYTIPTENTSLSIDYSKDISISSEKKSFEVCVISTKTGRYEGVLVYKTPPHKGTSIAVATWLRINVAEGTTQDQGSSIISSLGSSNSNPPSQAKINSVKEETTEQASEKIQMGAVQENNKTNPNEDNKVTGNIVKDEKDGSSNLLKYVLYSIAGIFALFILTILIIRTINIRKRRNKNVF